MASRGTGARWFVDATRVARLATDNQVSIDGTLIRTDRSKAAGPTAKVDLWWSGKHHHHGGNVRS